MSTLGQGKNVRADVQAKVGGFEGWYALRVCVDGLGADCGGMRI